MELAWSDSARPRLQEQWKLIVLVFVLVDRVATVAAPRSHRCHRSRTKVVSKLCSVLFACSILKLHASQYNSKGTLGLRVELRFVPPKAVKNRARTFSSAGFQMHKIIAICLLTSSLTLDVPAFADASLNYEGMEEFPGIGTVEAFNRSAEVSNKAAACIKTGDYEAAIKLYKKSNEIYPYSYACFQGLGLAFRESKRFEDAIAAYKKSIELRADVSRTWVQLGYTYELMRKLPEAERSYRKAVQLNPKLYEPTADLGDILRQRGKFEEAREWLLKAKDLPGKRSPDFIEKKLKQCDEKDTSP